MMIPHCLKANFSGVPRGWRMDSCSIAASRSGIVTPVVIPLCVSLTQGRNRIALLSVASVCFLTDNPNRRRAHDGKVHA
jgi:hypothetical protein